MTWTDDSSCGCDHIARIQCIVYNISSGVVIGSDDFGMMVSPQGREGTGWRVQRRRRRLRGSGHIQGMRL